MSRLTQNSGKKLVFALGIIHRENVMILKCSKNENSRFKKKTVRVFDFCPQCAYNVGVMHLNLLILS